MSHDGDLLDVWRAAWGGQPVGWDFSDLADRVWADAPRTGRGLVGVDPVRGRTAMLGYLSHMPWQLGEDFAVDAHDETLLALHRAEGPVVATTRRFLLEARRG